VVRANKWSQFEKVFSNQTTEIRYIREIIFGKRHQRTYWEITTDPETLPENSTSFVMTNLLGKSNQIKKILGNLYGLRTWVEYGFRQCKQELGWTDYRFTKFEQIERWWEIIMSTYLMISLNSKIIENFNQSQLSSDSEPTAFSKHQQWDLAGGWKSAPPALRFPQRIGRSKEYFK
jgi:SRSO17 transposase